VARDQNLPLEPQLTQGLWYVAPERTEIREEPLPAMTSEAVQVRSVFGALSRGTESLVLEGKFLSLSIRACAHPLWAVHSPFPLNTAIRMSDALNRDPTP